MLELTNLYFIDNFNYNYILIIFLYYVTELIDFILKNENIKTKLYKVNNTLELLTNYVNTNTGNPFIKSHIDKCKNSKNNNQIEIDPYIYNYLNSEYIKNKTNLFKDIYNNGVENGLIYSAKQIMNYDNTIKRIVSLTDNKLYIEKESEMIDLKSYVNELYNYKFEIFINDITLIKKNYKSVTETVIFTFIGNVEIGKYLIKKILNSDKYNLLNIFIFNINIEYKQFDFLLSKFNNKIIFISKEYGNDIIPTLQAFNKCKELNFKYVIKLHTKGNIGLLNKAVDCLLFSNVEELLEKRVNCNCIGHGYINIKKLHNRINNKKEGFWCDKLINKYKKYINKELFIYYSIFLCEKIVLNKMIEFISKNNYRSYFLNNMYDTNEVNVEQSPIHFLERLFGMIDCKETYNIIGLLGINCSISEMVTLLKNYLENNGHYVNLYDISEINKVKNSKNNIICIQPFDYKCKNIIELKYKPIALWVWEFKSLPNIFKYMEKYYKEIITVSDFCLEVFTKNLTIPVKKIELKSQIHNYLDKIPNHVIESKQLKSLLEKTKNRTVYGYCFDVNSSIIRKNVLNLVKAFSKMNNDKQILILKTRPYRSRPNSLENSIINQLYKIIENSEHIYIINEQISILDLYKLYTYFDYYISPHCGEGYGLTIYDNMVLGNKIISPYYSGEKDYLDRSKIIELNYEEKDINGLREHCIYGQMSDFKGAYISVESIEKCLKKKLDNIFIIDCQPLQHEKRGISTYGINLVNMLLENYSDIFSFILIINNFLSTEFISRIKQEKNIVIHTVSFKNIEKPSDSERNVNFNQNENEYEKILADYINNLNPKIFLNLSEFDRRKVMINIDLLDKNIYSMSIIYDLIPLKLGWLNSLSNKWVQNYYKQIENLKKYSKLLSISEFTKNDCSDIFNNNIENIGTGVNDYIHSFSKQYQQSVLEKFKINKKYIYCQTSYTSHKGIDFLYEQYLQLPDNIKNDLLLVIGCDLPRDLSINNDNNVIITGYLFEENLHILHENAWLFVFPSLYEGFGLPPVESMKHNKPVIVANNTSLVEVIGNDKFMFNHDEKSCSELITQLYNDQNLYNECIKNSIQRKDIFSWDNVCIKFFKLVKTFIIQDYILYFVHLTCTQDLNTGIQKVVRTLSVELNKKRKIILIKYNEEKDDYEVINDDELNIFVKWGGVNHYDGGYNFKKLSFIYEDIKNKRNTLIIPEIYHSDQYELYDKFFKLGRDRNYNISHIYYDDTIYYNLDLDKSNRELWFNEYMKTMSIADNIIPISYYSEKTYIFHKNRLGLNSSQNIEPIQLGIVDSLDKIRFDKNINSESNLIISNISNHERKNYKNLIEAFKLLRILHPNLKLIIFGHMWVNKFDTDNNIEYKSFISNEEKENLFNDCLFSVYPSLKEGYGMPIYESLIQGKSVICHNETSTLEIAKDINQPCVSAVNCKDVKILLREMNKYCDKEYLIIAHNSIKDVKFKTYQEYGDELYNLLI